MKYCNYHDVTSVYSLNSRKLPGRFSYRDFRSSCNPAQRSIKIMRMRYAYCNLYTGCFKMAASSVSGSVSTQPGQPVFVAGTRVGMQVIPENTERPRVVVPTNADTQPFAGQCVVARHSEWPADLQGAARVATNSPTPQPVSTKVKCTVECVSCWCSRHLERSHLA